MSRGGGYHAAALTYYSILSFFPAAALALGLLGVVGADAAAEDVRRALADLSVEQQFVDALRATIRLAVDQRQAEATVVLVLSLAAAGVGRGTLGARRGARPRRPAGSAGALRLLGQLRDTRAAVRRVGALGLRGRRPGERPSVSRSRPVADGAYLLAALLGAAAYAYIYAFVPPPPRPPRGALFAHRLSGC